VCAFETSVANSVRLADDVTSAGLSFPGVSWSKACNGSAGCTQQQCADCIAAVFNVISKSCNFVTFISDYRMK